MLVCAIPSSNLGESGEDLHVLVPMGDIRREQEQEQEHKRLFPDSDT